MSHLTFKWYNLVTSLDYQLGGVNRTVKIVHKTATPDPSFSAYIALDRTQKNFHLLSSDITRRISDSTRVEAFIGDYQRLLHLVTTSAEIGTDAQLGKFLTLWFPISLWSANGEPMGLTEIQNLHTRPPKFLATVSETLWNLGEEGFLHPDRRDTVQTAAEIDNAALSYARVWEQLLLAASEFSGKENHSATSKFDVMARFFNVPANNVIRPLRLVIVVSQWASQWLGEQDLIAACNATSNRRESTQTPAVPAIAWSAYDPAAQQQFVNPPQCRFIVARDGEILQNMLAQHLVAISTHPLNFYTTYVFRANLQALVDGQTNTNAGSWLRPLPPQQEVHVQDAVLLGKLRSFKKKMSQVAQQTTTRVTLEQNTVVDMKARQQTQNIMGDSANKWSRKIGWTDPDPKATIAEWLHREAHRFSGEEADLFPNLIFGSKECNTHMIRAENMINSVLQSNKVQKVDLATTVRNVPQIQMLQGDGTIVQINVPWYNQGGVMGRFYYWMAAELEYDITVTMVGGRPRQYTSRFLPFHRYYPLRYEVELDGCLLELYLDQIKDNAGVI